MIWDFYSEVFRGQFHLSSTFCVGHFFHLNQKHKYPSENVLPVSPLVRTSYFCSKYMFRWGANGSGAGAVDVGRKWLGLR
jgi:hypothetical protein